MPKTPTKKNKKKTTTAPEVPYPELSVKICSGEEALTVPQAKQLLGWEEETDEVKFGSDYLLTDLNKVKVRCNHNVKNRPLYRGIVETLKQEHLRKRWQLNGEPIIIGRTGLILNGQHTLISLVLAAQELEKDSVWSDSWEGTPMTMDKVVVFGIEETDNVVNTMDTCKPRSLADVIYRSEFFANLSSKDRKAIARTCDYAIRFVWSRTGASHNAFAPRRTHAEALDFLQRHPRLLDSVQHIHAENGGGQNQIGKFISPGYAAGLLYLMGSCESDPDSYSTNEPREEPLKWDRWDDACEFFVLLAAGSEEMDSVRKALGRILDDEGGSIPERSALLVKAWNRYSAFSGPVDSKNLKLEYHTDDDGVRTLAECPTVGGIDLGSSSVAERVPDPTPEEIEERAAVEREKRAAKKKGGGKAKAASDFPKVGDEVWVEDPNTKPWQGTFKDSYSGPQGQVAQVEAQDDGNTYDIPMESISALPV